MAALKQSMKEEKAKKQSSVLFTFIILLVLFTAYLFFLQLNYSSLKKEYTSYREYSENYKTYAENYFKEIRENLSDSIRKTQELDSSINKLNDKNRDLNDSYESLNNEYTNLMEDIDSTIDKIDIYEKELNDSMQWFKENSMLDKILVADQIKERLNKDCLRKAGDSCIIKAACIQDYNEKELRIRYKADEKTSNEEDKLQTLSQFVANKGGDCEDFSLFYNAEIRYLIRECSDHKDIVLESWKESEKLGDSYNIDFEGVESIQHASAKNLSAGYLIPIVICGTFFFEDDGSHYGHCVVAFSESEILSIKDIIYLNRAPIIEPQSGGYIGVINGESPEIVLASSTTVTDLPESFISVIITDSDLFLYSFKYHEWNSYSNFKDKLEENRQDLLDFR
ncbi:MAG: hypothetical protein KKF44_05660 [Nanoarchaeota archaeon]|nr:hypothetical protein [Nanoarchaeota archaeon]